MEPGCVARVIKDFLTTTEGELCMKAGEYLQVLEQVDRHWVRCRGEAREGVIPAANVAPADGIGRLRDGQGVLVVTSDFQGEQPGDMDLKRGTLVVLTETIDDHWARGRVASSSADEASQASGVFPPSFCRRLDPSHYIAEIKTRRSKVEKFAKVVHAMKAQLAEEIDLEEGDIVKVVEIIDKDWYRGECKGRSGTFPSSFVRIVDAFPGDQPPSDADLKSYLDAGKHKHNDYQNTRDTFAGLEEGLKAIGQRKMLNNVASALPEDIKAEAAAEEAAKETTPAFKKDDSVPKEIFEDEYFRQNLPASYGRASVDLAELDEADRQGYYDAEKSIFGGETARCSKGFQDMSANLRALHRRYQSEASAGPGSYTGYETTSSLGGANGQDDYPQHSSLTPAADFNKVSDNLDVFKKGPARPPAPNPKKDSGDGLTPAADYNRLAENLSVFKQREETDDQQKQQRSSSLDYNRLSENMSVFKSSIDTASSPFSQFRPREEELRRRESALRPSSDYNRLSENLNVFSGNVAAPSAPSAFAYQTVTCEGMGYTGESVDVRPYAVAKFNFVAEFDNELPLSAGEMVYLRRYVDNEWLEGEVTTDAQRSSAGGSKVGLFPIHYVNIIVDCNQADSANVVTNTPATFEATAKPSTSAGADSSEANKRPAVVKSTAVTVHDNLKPDTYHKVLYNFRAQMDGDVTAAEGEVVFIKEKQNDDWVVVETCTGESGVMPGNHLDPRNDSDGQALFDMERLLSYKNKKAEEEASRPFRPPKRNPTKDTLKFFDPLRSPDSEMMEIEEELRKKAAEPKVIEMPDNSVAINRSVVGRSADAKDENVYSNAMFQPRQPKDLETLISTNLSKLRSTSPSGAKILPSNPAALNPQQKVGISNMVLQELRGKNVSSGNPFQDLKERGFVRTGAAETPSPKLPSRKSVHAPPRPSQPPSRMQQHQSRKSNFPPYNKPKAPKPPVPPPPASVSSSRLEEPLYSQVNKSTKSDVSSDCGDCDLGSVLSSEDQQSPLPPPSYPPPRPSRPPLRHSQSVPAAANKQNPPPKPPPPSETDVITKTIMVTTAQVHEYDTPEGDEQQQQQRQAVVDQTPTNEEFRQLAEEGDDDDNNNNDSNRKGDAESVVSDLSTPSLPMRSSSILAKPGVVSRGETFRSYINMNDLGPPAFPPDKKSPMSPPPSGEALPPKVASLPCRSVSVASSIKSRSVFYNSAISYSPATSSLNHSYETLNALSEAGEQAPSNPNASVHHQGRKPSRPAPPVPVKEQFEHSKEVLFGNAKAREERRAWGVGGGSNRCPVTRRNLRNRKITSVKRQIQVKEKMLEAACASKEQLLRELDMYQEIAVAKGEHYDKLNRNMDHCQENIEALSDQIQRLQACLADEELKMEEDSVEETRRRAEEANLRRQLETQKREEEERKREQRRKRNREHRENVISELVQTETEFRKDLKLTWQAFGLDADSGEDPSPSSLHEQHGIDVAALFGNMSDVIDISERFLDTLRQEVKSQSCPSEQWVGRCFLEHAPAMKRAYTEYCVNNDRAEQLLEKYEAAPETHRVLQKGVEALQQGGVACFNMGSILIKPVQRILKYPLMLNELIKCTEEDHKDREDLQKAIGIMADVAAFINESKRRKDIVDKYKHVEDKTLTRKISKLNMHSIGKKSSRMGQKLLSSIGMDNTTRDYGFDELERKFSHVTRAAQLFCLDAQKFRETLHEAALSEFSMVEHVGKFCHGSEQVSMAQFNVAENVADLYKERVHTREVERFRSAHRNIISTYWNQYNLMLESRVVKPLQQLIETFQGPVRLIQKRQDKHLDYSASMQKAEKNKDPAKAKAEARPKSFREEMDECKTTYEALNSQLVEELPKLIDCSLKIYCRSVTQFILLRKLFVGRVTRELLSLMDLPLLASASGDILEVFLAKHSLVCNQLGRFSFSSKTFRPEDVAGAAAVNGRRRLGQTGGSQTVGQVTLTPQTATVRTFLRGKYAAVKLFQAQEMHFPRDPLDIGVSPGDLVGVVQKKDPMGNTDRWFVDNGANQGFVPARVLASVGEFDGSRTAVAAAPPAAPTVESRSRTPNTGQQQQQQQQQPQADGNQAHEYDDVAEDEDNDEQNNSDEDKKKPTRKAPPVPPSQQPPKDQEETETSPELETESPVVVADVSVPESRCSRRAEQEEEDLDEIKVAPPESEEEEEEERDVARDSTVSPADAEDSATAEVTVVAAVVEPNGARMRVAGGYEEIEAADAGAGAADNNASAAAAANAAAAAPSENNSEPSQDLSPIYEEIHGGSRSTVSTGSLASSSSSSNAGGGAGPRGKFHFSLYAFTATDSTMLSVRRGQVIRVIQVTPGEWWYVEDRNGDRGYVPHTYLKPYPTSGVVEGLTERQEEEAEEGATVTDGASRASGAVSQQSNAATEQ